MLHSRRMLRIVYTCIECVLLLQNVFSYYRMCIACACALCPYAYMHMCVMAYTYIRIYVYPYYGIYVYTDIRIYVYTDDI